MNILRSATLALTVSLLLSPAADGQNRSAEPIPDRFAGDEPVPATSHPGLPTSDVFRAASRHASPASFVGPLSTEAEIFLLTEQTSQLWDPAANGGSGDWMNESRVSYERNAAGFATEQLIEEWDSAAEAWIPSGRQVYVLDDQNRTTERRFEEWDPDANGGQGDWQPGARYRSTYDSEGNLVESSTEFWDEDTGDYFLWNRSTMTYENGRVSQRVFESTDFLTGMFGPSLRYNFEYDAAGNTTRRLIESYDDAAQDWENSSLRLWTFDGNGQETEDLEQSWDELLGDWLNDYREVTTYDPDSSDPTEIIVTAQDWDLAGGGGQGDWVNRDRGIQTRTSSTEVVETEQDWDPLGEDWINREQQITTLNSSGEFVESVSRTWDTSAGDWVDEERASFVRNQNGLITENLIEVWDGTQWVNDSRLLQVYGEFTGTAVEAESPQSRYSLQANYPNPFAAKTRITFYLPAAQHVTLEVYDLLGRRVTTLVDGLRPTGRQQVTLDAGDMAGGLYVYRLSGENVRLSRTMLLVR